MFARLATVVLFVLPAVIAVPTGSPAPSCTTGKVMCCNDAMSADPSSKEGLLSGLLGVVLGGINIPLQVNCIPAAGIGASGQSCTGQVACCTDNEGGSLVSLQCDPINVTA